MKKLVIASILVLLLLATAVSASDIFVTHRGDNVVEISGTVKFTLSITNSGMKTGTFMINPDPYYSLPSSYVATFAVKPKMVEIPNGQTRDVEVTLKMKHTVLPRDNYATYVTVEDIEDKSSKVEHNLVMNIIPPDEVVSVSTSIPRSVAPNGEFTVTVDFRNNMNTKLSDIEVYVGSELFEETKTMILFPLQERSEKFSFRVPAMAKPEEYAFSVRVYQNGVLNGKFSGAFTVQENSDVETGIEIDEGFLTKTVTVKKRNYGNYMATEYYDYPASRITGMFISASAVAASEDSDGLHWIFDIQPGGDVFLEVKVSYVPLLIALIVIAFFGAVAYYLLTRGLIVRKKIFKLKRSPGTARFTVMLHIKNRTRGPVRDMTVFEILPKFIEPSTHFSTLKPSAVQEGEKGEKLSWKIPELMKGEERIISYQVDSRITVLGDVSLPVCMVRYKNLGGRVVNVKSNRVRLELGSEKQ